MKYRTHYRRLSLSLLLGAFSALAQAQFTEIYTFNGNVEGCCAASPNTLAQGEDGFLYGTLPVGGTGNRGAWFVYPMSGAPALFNMGGNNSSTYPQPDTGLSTPHSGFALGIDGNFYGAASTVPGSNLGALFKMSGGTVTTIYSFTGVGGSSPSAAPVQGLDGSLYGVTKDSANSGYVYQVIPNANGPATPGWYLQLPSGSEAPLLLANDGNFYGTYTNGSFSRSASGAVVASPNGNGGIFGITPTGVVLWFYNLNPSSSTFPGGDGQNPYGPVMQAADGELYGSAIGGGSHGNPGGVLYKIALNGTGYNPFYGFQPAVGTAPMGGLVQASDGYLYGLASLNGTLTSPYSGHSFVPSGVLFRVATNGSNYTSVFTFFRKSGSNGAGPGSDPEATPVLHTNGVIYGLTRSGGSVTNKAPTGSGGQFDDSGEFFSYNDGLSPFISVVGQRSAHVGDRVTIIGQGFLNATGVTFGGAPISWVKLDPTIYNDNSMSVIVPDGARTGLVTVQESTGNLSTLYDFTIICNSLLCRPIHRI